MSLATKYRPKTWEEMTEQSLVGKMLKSLCESGLSNRNFLLIGPAGVGKTTFSKIIAREINENQGEPIELDAASHNGVEQMRDLVSQASLYPVGSKYKVFILDECHALSQPAWQVLLKVLEESPAKSVFIFCTTNPEKIPATILSRVQTFQLSKISLEGITNRLKYVLDAETSAGRNITYEDDAVRFIAKLANGGMRDALTLLDKALVYSETVSMKNLAEALNLPNYDMYFELLNACAKKDNKRITEIIDQTYNSGVNFVKWFEGFHQFLINIVKYILLKDINMTTIPSYYSDKVSAYSEAHMVVALKLSNKILELTHELKSTQYLQEVALTYLCVVK